MNKIFLTVLIIFFACNLTSAETLSDNIKDNILKEVVYFLAIKESGTLKRQEQEIDSLGFYSYNEALSLISYEDTVNIFKKVIEDIKNLNLHLK